MLATDTGNETKLGQNKTKPPVKVAKIDMFINKISVYIFCFQLSLALVLGALGDTWSGQNSTSYWYLLFAPEAAWYGWIIIPLRFLLLNSLMIPISLKVRCRRLACDAAARAQCCCCCCCFCCRSGGQGATTTSPAHARRGAAPLVR